MPCRAALTPENTHGERWGGGVDVSGNRRTLAGLDESLHIGYGGRRSHLQGERPPCAATAEISNRQAHTVNRVLQRMRRLTRPDENLHGAPWPVLSNSLPSSHRTKRSFQRSRPPNAWPVLP